LVINLCHKKYYPTLMKLEICGYAPFISSIKIKRNQVDKNLALLTKGVFLCEDEQ